MKKEKTPLYMASYLGLMIVAIILMITSFFVHDFQLHMLRTIITVLCVIIAIIGTKNKEKFAFLWWINSVLWFSLAAF